MNLSGSFLPCFWMEYSTTVFSIYVVISNLFYSTSSTILYLLFLLILWIIELFKLLTQRMKQLIDLNDSQNLSDVKLLKGWKRQHSMVVRLVDLLNECFGSIVTLIIIHGFVSITSYISMAVSYVNMDRDYEVYYSIASFWTEFCQLFMIVYAGHLLESHVNIF